MLILWVNLNLPFHLHSNSMKYVLLTQILWPPDASFWLIGKDADAGKIEGRKRRGPQRMRWLNGITNSMDMSLSKLWELAGQGGLACCSSWSCKESDMTQWLNWDCGNIFVILLTLYMFWTWSLSGMKEVEEDFGFSLNCLNSISLISVKWTLALFSAFSCFLLLFYL